MREGVTRSRCSWPTRACSCVDDSRSSAPCSAPASSARSSACTPRTACRSTSSSSRRSPTGHTAPIYHALTRPEIAEAEGTDRAIALAEMAKVPVYIVHLSAQRALEQVMEARDRGLPAYAETCPQYLFLSEDDLRGKPGDEFEGAKYVCTPPLRPKHHQDHLWRGLSNHDLQVVSTDHCPFCMKGQKELGRDDFSKIPNGMPGIETRLHLLYEGVREGRISLNRFVEITVDGAGQDLRALPEEGHHRRRRRRRPRRVGSGEALRALAQEPAHARRLLAVRGQDGHRRADRTCCRAASSSSRTTKPSARKGAASSCAAEPSAYEHTSRTFAKSRASTPTAPGAGRRASSRSTSSTPRARTSPTRRASATSTCRASSCARTSGTRTTPSSTPSSSRPRSWRSSRRATRPRRARSCARSS